MCVPCPRLARIFVYSGQSCLRRAVVEDEQGGFPHVAFLNIQTLEEEEEYNALERAGPFGKFLKRTRRPETRTASTKSDVSIVFHLEVVVREYLIEASRFLASVAVITLQGGHDDEEHDAGQEKCESARTFLCHAFAHWTMQGV